MTTLSNSGIRAFDETGPHVPPAAVDGVVLFLVGLLLTVGVVMVYSASVTVQGAPFDLRTWWQTPLRQGAFAAIGFVGMIVAARFDYRLLSADTSFGRRAIAWLWVLAAALLLLVLVPGIGSNRLGATRWIVFSSGNAAIGLQPGELAKVVLVIWLAAYVTSAAYDLRSLRDGLLWALVASGTLIGLTGIEDYGTAALMGVCTLVILLLGGARLLHLTGILILGAGAAALLLVLKSHRLGRVYAFLYEQPSPDSDSTYQIYQSLVAIGSGGWWGRGLGAGVQKYGYLPQDNNDFILAIICEELGIVGGLTVAGVFLLLLLRGWWIAINAPDRFGRVLACGLTAMICLQAAFNIAVVTNSVPTKGISLPFVSAGGSGVLFLGIAAGVLASVGGQAQLHFEKVRAAKRASEGGVERQEAI